VLNQVPHHEDPWEVLPHLNFGVLHVTKSLEWSAIKNSSLTQNISLTSVKRATLMNQLSLWTKVYVCVYKEKVGTTQVQHTKYTLCLVLTVCAAALSSVTYIQRHCLNTIRVYLLCVRCVYIK